MNILMKTLRTAIEELRSLPAEGDARTKYYKQHVFPHYRKAFAKQAQQRPPCDLLITAVGTQPFSPALAIAATAPRVCVLLTTHQTEALVDEVTTLSRHRPEVLRVLSIGDGMDSGLVMDVVQAEYLRWGGSRPEEVTVDVTSGRKATAAALGAAASALGLRQAYVESAELLAPGLGLEPKYHLLPEVTRFESRGVGQRALALLDYGHYADAAKEFAKGGSRWRELAIACEVLAASVVSTVAAELLVESSGISWLSPPPIDAENDLATWRNSVRAMIAKRARKS